MNWRALLSILLLVAGSLIGSRGSVAQPGIWTDAEVNGLRYRVLLPDAYDADRRYPVLLYLHQLDMGDYPEGLLRQVNAWFETAAFRFSHPCIVVMPLLDQNNDQTGRVVNFGGVNAGHTGEDNALAALRQVIDRYLTDAARIYVTGNSMGGIGTWQMLLDYNLHTGRRGHVFAAGMPLAGANYTTDPAQAAKLLGQVPIWAIHGAHDKTVPLNWDRRMARLLAGHKTFRYTEDPALGHNVWDTYYARAHVWNWLFSQGGE